MEWYLCTLLSVLAGPCRCVCLVGFVGHGRWFVCAWWALCWLAAYRRCTRVETARKDDEPFHRNKSIFRAPMLTSARGGQVAERQRRSDSLTACMLIRSSGYHVQETVAVSRSGHRFAALAHSVHTTGLKTAMQAIGAARRKAARKADHGTEGAHRATRSSLTEERKGSQGKRKLARALSQRRSQGYSSSGPPKAIFHVLRSHHNRFLTHRTQRN